MKRITKIGSALLLTASTSACVLAVLCNSYTSIKGTSGASGHKIILNGSQNTYTGDDVFYAVTESGSTVQMEIGGGYASTYDDAFCHIDVSDYTYLDEYYVGNKTPISGIDTIKISCSMLDWDEDEEYFDVMWGWSEELETQSTYLSATPHFDEKSNYVFEVNEEEYILYFDFFEEKPSFFRISPCWYETVINSIEVEYSCEASEIAPVYNTDMCKYFESLNENYGYYTPRTYRGENVETITFQDTYRGSNIGWINGNGVEGLDGVKTLIFDGEGFTWSSSITCMFLECYDLENIYFPDDFFQTSRPKNGGEPIISFRDCPNVKHIYTNNEYITTDVDNTCFVQNGKLFLGTQAIETIPSNVTKICCGAFDNCEMSIVIPETVTDIEEGAFRNFKGEIYLPFAYDELHSEVPAGYKANFIRSDSAIKVHYSNGRNFTGYSSQLFSVENGYAA